MQGNPLIWDFTAAEVKQIFASIRQMLGDSESKFIPAAQYHWHIC